MKILIYSESEEAKALATELREDKNNEVGIRTNEAQFFNAENPEAADFVHAWDEFIADAYEGKAEVNLHVEKAKAKAEVKKAAKKAKK